MNKTYKISDDSGFIGLVNVDKYDSFVDEDWEFNDLRERVIQEMNRGNLLFWSTGQEGLWNVRVTTVQTEHKPFRAIKGKIGVTDKKLFLINYEDLSMAAQYEDEKLPLKHNADLGLEIDNGGYNVAINQLFDPQRFTLDDDSDEVHFEIVLEKSSDGEPFSNEFAKIPWQK